MGHDAHHAIQRRVSSTAYRGFHPHFRTATPSFSVGVFGMAASIVISVLAQGAIYRSFASMLSMSFHSFRFCFFC